MILDRPGYPLPPDSGPRDGREVSRVLRVMSAGHLNAVVDLDLSGAVSPYTLEHANISAFSWIRERRDLVTVGEPGKGTVQLTWAGPGPALARILVLG